MKNLLFDHLVHFTNSPTEAKESLSSLGFQTINGGEHPMWGTHNTLCYFNGLKYLEWIGIKDLSIAKQSDNVLIQQLVKDAPLGEGFVQLAFRTDNIEMLAEQLQQKGYKPIGPFNGSRKREDGSTLEWSMLFIEDNVEAEVRYPFFIQWGDSEEQREQQMKSLFVHENKADTIEYIGIATTNKVAASTQYKKLFSLNESIQQKDEYGSYEEIQLGGIALRLYEAVLPEWEKRIGRPCLCGIKRGGVNLVNLHGADYIL
mgnify:CR=1 FL=1